MSKWNVALHVEYQQLIKRYIDQSHIKMEFWHEFDAIDIYRRCSFPLDNARLNWMTFFDYGFHFIFCINFCSDTHVPNTSLKSYFFRISLSFSGLRHFSPSSFFAFQKGMVSTDYLTITSSNLHKNSKHDSPIYIHSGTKQT